MACIARGRCMLPTSSHDSPSNRKARSVASSVVPSSMAALPSMKPPVNSTSPSARVVAPCQASGTGIVIALL